MPTHLVRLSRTELDLKTGLEKRIADSVQEGKRSHFIIGECLDSIITHRLYRDDYPSFEAYCEEEWGFSGVIGRRAANTFRVAKTLESAEQSAPEVYWSILTGLQPSHAGVLAKLPDAAQPAAWSEARQTTTTPTVKALEEVVARHKDRLEQLPSMTAQEESAFNADVERESLEAYQRGKVQEVAALSGKRLRSIRRGIPESLVERFAGAIVMLDNAEAEFKRLGD